MIETISISIVLFNPDMNVLRKVFHHLKAAIFKAVQISPAHFTLYLIDNSVSSMVEKKLQSAIADCFTNDSNVTLKFISTGKNIGYGSANNIAIQQTISKYHLVMNPDVFLYENTLINALKYMQMHPNIGLLIPDVYGVDGARHYLCKQNPTIFDMFLRSFAPKFLKNKYAQRMLRFEMRDKNYDAEILDVPFPTGCFMFMRTDVLKQLNGFDEQFFLYYEDADIGRRLLNISHSAYVPEVKIIHQWARESKKNLKMLGVFIKSALLYWRKQGGLF